MRTRIRRVLMSLSTAAALAACSQSEISPVPVDTVEQSLHTGELLFGTPQSSKEAACFSCIAQECSAEASVVMDCVQNPPQTPKALLICQQTLVLLEQCIAAECNGATWWRDWDGDGYGADGPHAAVWCWQVPFHVTQSGDCDDFRFSVNPGREEILDNGRDDDCDPSTPDTLCGGPGGACFPLEGAVTVEESDDGIIGDGIAGSFISGDAPPSAAGRNVRAVDDVDGDGHDDFLVAELRPSSARGRVHLFYGPVAPGALDLSSADATFIGEAVGADAGASLAAAGDVDADGLADFLIGAPLGPHLTDRSGATYLIFGRAQRYAGTVSLALIGAGVDGLVLTGEKPLDGFGTDVDGGRDFDGDGYDDLLIGAPFHEAEVVEDPDPFGDGVGRVGAAYLIYGDHRSDLVGRTSVDCIALGTACSSVDIRGFKLLGDTFIGDYEDPLLDEHAGFSVALVQDMTGDGRGEIAVGAPGHDYRLAGAWNDPEDRGAVYVAYGNASRPTGTLPLCRFGGPTECDGKVGPTYPGFKLIGEGGFTLQRPAGDRAGWSVANGGDLDGDGNGDLLVSAPGFITLDTQGNPLAMSGAVYAIYGPGSGALTGTVDACVIAHGPNAAACSGRVGASVNVPGTRFEAGQDPVTLGWRVRGGRDLDGDGRSELLVSERPGILEVNAPPELMLFPLPLGTPPAPTRLHLVYGEAQDGTRRRWLGARPANACTAAVCPRATRWAEVDGPEDSFTGEAADIVGDHNDDGLAELLVGAPRWLARGAAWLIYGLR